MRSLDTSLRLSIATAAVLAASAIGEAASAAPLVTMDRPCYSATTPMRVFGTGFTPSGTLQISGAYIDDEGTRDEAGTFPGRADSEGDYSDVFGIPQIGATPLRFRLTIEDRTAIAVSGSQTEHAATATAKVVPFGVTVAGWNKRSAARARPGRSTVLHASGFFESSSRTLYVHYILKGRVVKTQRLGRLSGPCRSLERRIREFDFRRVPKGTYRVTFDTSRYRPNEDISSFYRRVIVR